MRERSTWNRTEIARTASFGRRAEDPTAMNQDHISQQPAADEYVTGDPSTFAEDVHPSAGTWKAEYKGGEVARNEIGMPEMRKDTFNHPEKTAAMLDDDEVLKKANLCASIARKMLKNASEEVLEEQALALMDMPDVALIDTANRLAKVADDDEEEDEGQGQGQQEKQAKQSDDEEKQGQQEEKKQGQGQQEEKKGQGQEQKQSKKAGQVPPQFKEHQKKKKEDGDEEEEEGQSQKKQARGHAGNAFIAALKAGNGEGVEQALGQMLSQALGQMQQQSQQQMAQNQQQMAQDQGQAAVYGQGQEQQQMAQDQEMARALAQQQAPMGQQQQAPMGQQQQAPMGQQQQAPMGQQQQMSDDQLLDQMLQDDMGMGQPQGQPQVMGMGYAANVQPEIQLEPNTMDVGEIQLGAGDEVLNTLFASNPEYRNAAEAHALQNGGMPPVTAQPSMTRTAATRTVGTRPSAGVSQIGRGVVAGQGPGGNEVDKLSGLWQSAPDVSNVFR